MYDAALLAKEKASGRVGGSLLETHGLESGNYVLVTIHRAENTDDSERLLGIFNSLRLKRARHRSRLDKLRSSPNDGDNFHNAIPAGIALI
jgi:UDP-GlcNAc3NAcA epimerase